MLKVNLALTEQEMNVPIDVNTMATLLPRNLDDDHCNNVNIERMKIHKSSSVYEKVYKKVVKVWLRYLITT